MAVATRRGPARSHAEIEAWSYPVLQARSRETRDRLLVAAEKVFDEKGYEGARIADIAKEAGCSVGAIYVRFKDKDALFSGIVAAFRTEASIRVSDVRGQPLPNDPATIVRIFVRGAALQFQKHRGLFRAIMQRGFSNPESFAPAIDMREHIEGLLEEVLRAAMPKTKRDLGLAVRVVTQMVFGFMLNAILNPYAPTKREAPRALAELETAVLKYLDLA